MEHKAKNSLSIQTNTTQERNQTDKHLNIMDTYYDNPFHLLGQDVTTR